MKNIQTTFISSVSLAETLFTLPSDYSFLNLVPVIHKIDQPTLRFSKVRKRFMEVKVSPLSQVAINEKQWSCYPAYWDNKLTYIYIHEDNLFQGLAFCNLFERALVENPETKPEVIYLFGMKDYNSDLPTIFHRDIKNDITLIF